MAFRPAFLNRFLSLFPDPLSLRFQAVGWTGLVAGSFALLLVLAAAQLDARRCAEVARARAETLALTAGTWLDGDAHAGLGQEPEKRLSDLTALLEKLLEKSDYDGMVRTLRPHAKFKPNLAAQPAIPRAKALETVLQTDGGKTRLDVDYTPELGAALFEGHCVSVRRGDSIAAYAPIPDSWGSFPAIVWVEGPAVAPLWRRILFPLGAALFSGLCAAGAVALARKHARWFGGHAAVLQAGVEQLAGGHVNGSLTLAARAPSELAALAESLEALRARLEAQATGQPLPVATSESAPAPETNAALGEATEFDLALLLQQLVEPARKSAHGRGVDVQLVFPDGIPSRLVGHAMALFRALDGLLRNSLRTTRSGHVTLRVSRAGDDSEGYRLRFEIADTSPGIAFKEQQELAAALATAATADPGQLRDPLQLASSMVNALGGELGFESQPGQGSRFGFMVAFQATAPRAPTTFQARPATGFQPRPIAPSPGFPSANGLGPPISSFQPRKSLGAR